MVRTTHHGEYTRAYFAPVFTWGWWLGIAIGWALTVQLGWKAFKFVHNYEYRTYEKSLPKSHLNHTIPAETLRRRDPEDDCYYCRGVDGES
jgi:hypothetical protein